MFFFFNCKKIYIFDFWMLKFRNIFKYSKVMIKIKLFFRVILKWILIIWMEFFYIYIIRWIKIVDGNYNKKWLFILVVILEN